MNYSDAQQPQLELEQQDTSIAVRNSSLVCALAGLWFAFSPHLVGHWMEPGAGNCHLIGGAVFLFACLRVLMPLSLRALSFANAGLGAWMLASPWIFGYSGDSIRLANSLSVGAVVLTFATVSIVIPQMRGTDLPKE